MAKLIFRDTEGALRVGSDESSDEIASAVYRTERRKDIVVRDGIFVEVDLIDGSTRNLFRVAE